MIDPMDPKSGQFVEVSSEQEAIDQGLIPVPASQLAKLKTMTPQQRKLWASKLLKRHRPARSTTQHEGPNRHERRKAAALARGAAK